jgi:hypothetical protein
VHIVLEIASALDRLTRKTDCEVREVCSEEARGPMVNYGLEGLETRMMKMECVSHVRQTMEVVKNVHWAIVHLAALTHLQKT